MKTIKRKVSAFLRKLRNLSLIGLGILYLSYGIHLEFLTSKPIEFINQYIPPALAAENEKVEPLEVIEVPKNAKQEWIEHLYREAARYGADPEKMIRTINCETGHTWQPDIQSGYHYPSGGQEQSFGLAQIHLSDHPQVSYDEATNPEYAITFMAQHFGENNGRIWSCYRSLYGKQSSTI